MALQKIWLTHNPGVPRAAWVRTHLQVALAALALTHLLVAACPALAEWVD